MEDLAKHDEKSIKIFILIAIGSTETSIVTFGKTEHIKLILDTTFLVKNFVSWKNKDDGDSISEHVLVLYN